MSLLLEALQESKVKKTEPQSLMQKKAWEHFLELGLPQKELESFRYVSLQKLYQSSFSLVESFSSLTKESLPPAQTSIRFVFVNGYFKADLSDLEALDTSVIYSTLEEAAAHYPSLIKAKEEKFFKEKKGALSYLNATFYDKGFFLYIPPKTVLKEKIEFLEIFPDENKMVFPKAMIYVGKGSSVSFICSVEETSSSFINSSIEIHLEANSKCTFQKNLLNVSSGWYFHHLSAFLKKDSKLKYYSADQGSSCIKMDYNIELLEENGEAILKGISLLGDARQTHHFINVKHVAPHCQSHQHFKTLFFDKARGSFEGKIWVDATAQKTQAYQLCNYLLLSDEAHAYAKPNLEIFADDVKASHGATFSQLSKEELFYLKARGLDENVAKMLLIRGFCQEIGLYFEEKMQKLLYKQVVKLLYKDG